MQTDPRNNPSDEHSPPRVDLFGTRLGLVVIAVVAVASNWIWQSTGRVASHRIVGGSMAEALLGSHFRVRCGDCQYSFACDRDEPPRDMQAVCPNCGFGANTLNAESVQPGDQVLVDCSAFGNRSPRRWEIVALRESHEMSDGKSSQRAAVKRVVALPNEHVAIRHGDLYIDDRLLRKSLPLQRYMAIPVHDDRFRPARSESLPHRWRATENNSQWRQTEAGYQFRPDASHASATSASLVYHHWRCMPVPLGIPRTDDAPIRDNYAYNQGLSRQLHDVGDLLLTCRIRLTGSGRFAVSMHDGYDWLHASLSTRTNVVELTRGESTLDRMQLREILDGRELLLEFSRIDRQAILAINRRVILWHIVEPQIRSFQPSPTPVTVSAADLHADIRDLRIDRDIYYFDPGGAAVDWRQGYRLGRDEYFVLGDNVPISVDSRRWLRPGVSRKLLLGKVLDRTHRPCAPSPPAAR